MSEIKLKKLLNDISKVKIAIVGDFCLDAYWFIDDSMSETSVETNLATRPVSVQKYSLGGAGNVANNLAAMGVRDIRVFGVIGPDPFGTKMTIIMNETGINTGNLLVQEHEWNTHTYAKPYAGNHELNRIDFGNFSSLSEQTADRLIVDLKIELSNVDIVIINQQVPSGIHTGYFKDKLLSLIQQFPDKKFIADSRKYNDFYAGSIRKMNDTEALRLCGEIKNPDEIMPWKGIVPAAKKLFKRYNKPIFITRGSRGSLTIDESGINEIPGLLILSKVDTVGAGDSFLAGVASALAAGYNMEEAAEFGTLTAGVTVQKLFQTGTATPEEIMAIGKDPDFIYSPELAEDIRYAKYIKNTELEIINKLKERPAIRHAIFDNDGTVSTLREGWELIMAPMMTRAILGDKSYDAGITLLNKVRSRVDEYIDKTTGIQTLAQMYGLVDLIKELGCIPAEKILDPSEYKQIYNEELLRMVENRNEKLQNGELSVEDLTIKMSVQFLQILCDSGIKLYLVSGTDVEDVINEARMLGYDHFFEDRIFGSVGDVTKEAKKIVIDKILGTIGERAAGKIVTFGDGPVEIRETRKRGGITIGVASNELRRYGLNEHKRTRLIKAGADVIIPDFSQTHQLLRLLNI